MVYINGNKNERCFCDNKAEGSEAVTLYPGLPMYMIVYTFSCDKCWEGLVKLNLLNDL